MPLIQSCLAGIYFAVAVMSAVWGKPWGVLVAMIAFAMHAYFALTWEE